MMTNQTLGRWGRPPARQCEYLVVSFSPFSAPLRQRWRNNGVSADFLGDYVKAFLPAEINHAEIQHAVAFVANEFLENAMKYHECSVDIPIGLRLELTSEEIALTVSNSIGAAQAERYRDFVANMLSQDTGDLILARMEQGADGSDESASGLGLLTMMSDYGVELGWRFEAQPDYPEMMTVTTSAVLNLTNPEGAA